MFQRLPTYTSPCLRAHAGQPAAATRGGAGKVSTGAIAAERAMHAACRLRSVIDSDSGACRATAPGGSRPTAAVLYCAAAVAHAHTRAAHQFAVYRCLCMSSILSFSSFSNACCISSACTRQQHRISRQVTRHWLAPTASLSGSDMSVWICHSSACVAKPHAGYLPAHAHSGGTLLLLQGHCSLSLAAANRQHSPSSSPSVLPPSLGEWNLSFSGSGASKRPLQMGSTSSSPSA